MPEPTTTTPSITTVDIDLSNSAGHEIVRGLLEGPEVMPKDAFEVVRRQLSVIQGESTLTPRP